MPTMTYRYPRTIAEITAMRAAEVAAQAPASNRLPAERPRCVNPEHGYLVLRPAAQQTYEQRFCGTWYDCAAYNAPTHRCGTSELIKSRDLCHQLGEPYFDGTSWQQHDGQAWQPVTSAAAAEFFQRRADEQQQYIEAARRRSGRTPRHGALRRGGR